MAELVGDEELVGDLARRCARLDGRAVAKVASLAVCVRREVACDPALLSPSDLPRAVDLVRDDVEAGA